jgi:hypothetical protein
MALDSLNVIVLVTMSAVAGILVYRSTFGIQTQQQQVQQTPSVVEVVTSEYPRPDPYWVNYGLPEYWPVTLSPYWYYGAPWYGPIGPIGSWGGYDRPGRGHPSHRGYSGVASGGGGGGGHGGGGGGR